MCINYWIHEIPYSATDERDVSVQQVFYGSVQEGEVIDRLACSLGHPALASLLTVPFNENSEPSRI